MRCDLSKDVFSFDAPQDPCAIVRKIVTIWYQRIYTVIVAVLVNLPRISFGQEISGVLPLWLSLWNPKLRSSLARLWFRIRRCYETDGIVEPRGNFHWVSQPILVIFFGPFVAGRKGGRKIREVGSVAELARQAGVSARYVIRMVRMGFLAPDLIQAILDPNRKDDRGPVEGIEVLPVLQNRWGRQGDCC